jgi:type I restriction enzyme S subunit
VQTAKTRLVSEAYGGGQPNINAEVVRSVRIGLPALEEQVQILSFVVGKTRHLATAISRLEREIDLLREYRTRLVADVVTGKLDVRAAAARLPDEESLLATPDTGDSDLDDDLAADEEVDA